MYFISRLSLIIFTSLSLCATEDTLRATDAPNLPERTITSMIPHDTHPNFSSILTKSKVTKQSINLEVSNGVIQRKALTINSITEQSDEEEKNSMPAKDLPESVITEESI